LKKVHQASYSYFWPFSSEICKPIVDTANNLQLILFLCVQFIKCFISYPRSNTSGNPKKCFINDNLWKYYNAGIIWLWVIMRRFKQLLKTKQTVGSDVRLL